MDRMRMCLNTTVGVACISTLFQVGIVQSKVNAASVTPDQQAKSYASSSPAPSDLALVSDVSDKTKSEAKAETTSEPVITAPKVSVKNPLLDLKITPRESKMDAKSFESPAGLGEPINFRATAYALSGRTRSGAYVRRGVIAADPRVLPLGSVVQLQAGDWSGVYTVHDTGGRIKGNIVDVWVPTKHEARQFGRRSIKVHVLRFGPKGRPAK